MHVVEVLKALFVQLQEMGLEQSLRTAEVFRKRPAEHILSRVVA